MHRRIAKHGKRLDDLSDEQRHRLRIRIKKLRYALKAFRSLFPKRKRARRYPRLLASLQDALGSLNDQAVTSGLLDRLASDATPTGIAFVRGATVSATRIGLGSVAEVWREFRRCPHPWA